MNFVYPALLFGLVSLAIPILIHLFNLRKFKKVYFSNVLFLREVKEETSKTNKLKHLLVLFCRLLFLLFLILAFAQPYIKVNQSSQTSGINFNSIYIDNSFSMELQNEEGQLLDQAKSKTLEIISAYRDNDKFQILSNEFSGESQRFVSKEEAVELVAELKITPESRTLDEIIKRQKSILKEVNSENRNGFVISDFQKNLIAGITTSDTSIKFRFIKLQVAEVENLSIDSVWFLSPIHKANSAEALVVQFSNYSNSDLENISYDFIVNGTQKAIGTIDIKANQKIVDTVFFKNSGSGIQLVEIKLKDQSVHFDDSYYFNFEIQTNTKVLLIDANNQSANYIKSVYETEPFVKLETVAIANVNYSIFNQFQTIILNEPKEISSGFADEIKNFLAKGGYLIYIPSFESNLNSINNFLTTIRTSNLISIQQTNQRIAEVNTKEGTLNEVFLRKDDRMDLPEVKSYFTFSNSISENIFKLSDGNSVFQKSKYGKGSVYLFAFPLNLSSNNLVKHALMVPVFLRIPQIAISSKKLAYVLGQEQSINLNNQISEGKESIYLKLKNEKWIPELKQTQDGAKMMISDDLKSAGHYQLIDNQKIIDAFSFNYNRNESDLNYFEESDLNQLGLKNLTIWKAGKQNINNSIKRENFGVQLWKICVILALIFMAFEVLILRYMNQKSNIIRSKLT